MEEKEIGLQDKNGEEICVGDTVEFFFGERYMFDINSVGYDHINATRMEDEVVEIEGVFYFQNKETKGCAFAWRHNKHCSIINKG